MRYAQGGGLTDERRFFREKLRIEAAERFAQGDENSVIAHDLRVSVRSVQRWRRAWSQNGPRALASKGPGGARCKLDPGQLRVLATVLDVGPAASGWSDQCWTLARIAEIVRRRFGVEYTLAGLDLLLHRIGWSVQVPSRRATERDEAKIAAWKDEQWPVIKRRRRTWAPGSASKTKPARA